jgi:hypothetical protein
VVKSTKIGEENKPLIQSQDSFSRQATTIRQIAYCLLVVGTSSCAPAIDRAPRVAGCGRARRQFNRGEVVSVEGRQSDTERLA